MAIASQWLGARYNRPGYTLFDFRAWTICGDGCLMEGISGEAASLGVLKRFGAACSPGMLSFPRVGTTLTVDFAVRGDRPFALLDDLAAIDHEAHIVQRRHASVRDMQSLDLKHWRP